MTVFKVLLLLVGFHLHTDLAVNWHTLNNLEYYIANNSSGNFSGALAICKDLNATLAKVNSIQILELFGKYKAPRQTFYFGLKRNESNGIFQWLDGTMLTWSNWRDTQPDNTSGKDNCVIMGDSKKWSDVTCSPHNRFICERYIVTDPTLGTPASTEAQRPNTVSSTLAAKTVNALTTDAAKGTEATAEHSGTTKVEKETIAMAVGATAGGLLILTIVASYFICKRRGGQSTDVPAEQIQLDEKATTEKEVVDNPLYGTRNESDEKETVANPLYGSSTLGQSSSRQSSTHQSKPSELYSQVKK